MRERPGVLSTTLVLLGAAGCITPPTSTAAPSAQTASPQEPAGTSTEALDPARVYASHLERAARLEEECERGAVDLEAYTDTAAYLLQFEAHPIRDAALVGLETCRQRVIETFEEVQAQSRPERVEMVARTLDEMMQESLQVLGLEGEIGVEHEGTTITVTLDVASAPEPVTDADTFESLCGLVQLYGVQTLVLIDNGTRSECSPTPDESALMHSVFEEINLSPPLDPPPAGEQPIPIE